jgi:hypothetical protein
MSRAVIWLAQIDSLRLTGTDWVERSHNVALIQTFAVGQRHESHDHAPHHPPRLSRDQPGELTKGEGRSWPSVFFSTALTYRQLNTAEREHVSHDDQLPITNPTLTLSNFDGEATTIILISIPHAQHTSTLTNTNDGSSVSFRSCAEVF